MDGYYRYWGKARSDIQGGPQYHLLPYHCLDVAAVGHALLPRQGLLLMQLADLFEIGYDELRGWATFLLSLHDVGKFADGFQSQIPALFERLQKRTVNAPYNERHDVLGYRFCKDILARMFMGSDSRWSSVREDDLWDLLDPWVSAVTGHHGRPPAISMHAMPIDRHFPNPVRTDAETFIGSTRALLFPNGVPFAPGDYDTCLEAFHRGSWFIAGLAVVADWAGSNQAWFPYREADAGYMSLSDYWEKVALPQAETAVAESGLLSAAVAPPKGLRALFPRIGAPTPLQELAEAMELSEGPQLFIIEEVTGGGKTEAALTLAHRLMAMGLGDGLYMALPTMATANAMYARVRNMYHKLFVEDAKPSLVLAHSFSRMALDLEEKNRVDRGYGRENSASQDCAAWLTDSRKKALLADVGVGTIDQALLAVLAARHQSLRLLGLVRKVLIVDEVHACDAYMHRILCTLLQFHAAQGGSAILLSATLPRAMRGELLGAYAGGAEATSHAYPLLTQLSRDSAVQEFPVKACESASRRMEVRPLHDPDNVRAMIQGVLDAGGCVCWVRNTVHDALAAYREWVERLGDDRVMLFHARFALGDRLSIEQEVLRCFGPESVAADREGKLLIATQVVEQSLDLDFDGMVTDLAPIDLIIQRAGRLQRHARSRRLPPALGVFMPPPSNDVGKDWFKGFLPKAAAVYPHHGQLWLTARWLCERKAFAMPEDARAMIESVYGEAPQETIPPGLQQVEDQVYGKDKADESLAWLNGLKLDEGYKATMSQWQDDVYAPTRLGEPMVMVRLARWDGTQLTPWYAAGSGHDWELSQVAIRQFVIAAEDQGKLAGAITAAKATMPDEGRYCVVVPLEQLDGKWRGYAHDKRGEKVCVFYDARTGLETSKGDKA